jgi:hypothetical protein
VDRRAAAKNGAIDIEEKETGLDVCLPYNPAACGLTTPVSPCREEPRLNENQPLSVNPRRLIAAIVIAAALLVAIIIGMGTVTFSSPGNVASVTVPPAAPTAAATAAVSGTVRGEVSAAVTHLSGHTYRFVYTVRDVGTTPIAGFQLNGPKASLFKVTGNGWHAFGSGICNGNNPDLLVYWSTRTGASNQIKPGQSRRFSFSVNTSGTITDSYALSYATAAAEFGKVQGPAESSLAPSGSCG